MYAVIFEVCPTAEGKDDYLAIAAELKQHLADVDGCLSIERFQSLADPDKLLSLSFWRDEAAIATWRNTMAHRAGQAEGMTKLFRDYRIRVAEVTRDYTLADRSNAPEDSRAAHTTTP